jgi:hypothetical protein
MTAITKVTRAIDINGLEFFTLDVTGESGMSQTALAVLCGVDQSSISRLAKSLMLKSPSKTLEPFVGKDFELCANSEYKNATIYKASFCVAVLRHYDRLGIETAQASIDRFAEMGINQWIQDITNYVPKELLEPANPLLVNITAWTKQRLRGKSIRLTYQTFVIANGGNIAQWTNWAYENFFMLKASEIRDAMEKVRGSQSIARNYLAYTRHLCIIEHFEFTVVQLHRQTGSTDLAELHKLAARETYEKFKVDSYCLI